MSADYGRNVVFTWDGVAVKAREKSLTIDGEAANVTDDGDSGWQVLLDEDAEVSVSIELTGVYKDPVFREAKIAGTIQETATLTYADGRTITGTFNLGSYSEGQPYNDAITYTASFMSTGPVTAGAPS
jgi:predicted secreted protein